MSKRLRMLIVPGMGVLAGVTSGLFGVGGGVILVPLLVAVVHLSEHEAHATSLVAILPIAATGVIVFAFGEGLAWGYGALLAAGSILGAPIGALVAARTDENTLKAAFGAFMIVVGLLLLFP